MTAAGRSRPTLPLPSGPSGSGTLCGGLRREASPAMNSEKGCHCCQFPPNLLYPNDFSGNPSGNPVETVVTLCFHLNPKNGGKLGFFVETPGDNCFHLGCHPCFHRSARNG